jgi:DNA helicase-2/ATP-dependent DNA helicase PcrA
MILNEAQTQAVYTVEGPLMVIAGPGTGKTQILSSRVAQILEQTDMLPENILCLTFSDAAAVAMKKRLMSMIGAASHRVAVFTFHSFCQRVISDYQAELSVLSLEPISDLETIEYYNKLIDKLELGNPLKHYKIPYFYRKQLIALNKILKQEQLEKDDLISLIEKRMEDMKYEDYFLYKRNTKDAKKGDLNPRLYNEAVEKLNRLIAAVHLCFDYRSVCEKNGRYDFDDMIRWVIDLFKTNEAALLHYQEIYQYIMVDEYQDTNNSQNELTFLLASYWDSPNLMVVGDDDQSIYRFQGANIENLHDFAGRFAHDLQKIVLSENYRSSQNILNTATHVIQKNTNRLIDDKQLLAKSNALIADGPPVVSACFNQIYECAYVYNAIEKAHSDGIPYSEMAVIYRNHEQAEHLQSYLKLKGVPFYLKRRTDILSYPLIQNVLELLEYIADEKSKSFNGEYRLFKILHFDFWEIPTVDLAKFAWFMRRERLQWRTCINELGKHPELLSLLSETAISRIAKLSEDLEYWIGKSFNLPLQQLVEKVISKGGILSYVLQSPSKQSHLQALQTFFDHLKDETRKSGSLSLENYLSTLALMKENNVALEIEEILEKGDGVNLMTAHSSKGLEFELVFIVGCNDKYWDKTKDRVPFNLRDVLYSSDDQLIEENRRLFYVACTRAKSFLKLSYNLFSLDEKPLQESVFVTELMESGIPQKKNVEIVDEQIMEVQLSLFGADTPDKNFEPLEANFLNQFTDDYVLSATHLDNYLECPVKFYYRNLLQIPSAKTGPLSFGNAIHKALELFFKFMLKDPDKNYPDLQQMVGWFKMEMDRNRDSFTVEDFTRNMEYGSEKVLPKLYGTFLPEWEANKNREPEKNLANVVVNNVPIKGKLDQLVFLDKDTVNVIDFKTGKFNTEKKKTLQPPKPDSDKEEEKFGGNYWRQVAFYHLLVNNDPLHHYRVISGEMFFVEPDKEGKFKREKIFVNDDELSFMEQLIADVYHKIKNHEFSEGCGKDNCEWCNFNKFYIRKELYRSAGLMSGDEE